MVHNYKNIEVLRRTQAEMSIQLKRINIQFKSSGNPYQLMESSRRQNTGHKDKIECPDGKSTENDIYRKQRKRTHWNGELHQNTLFKLKLQKNCVEQPFNNIIEKNFP